MVVSESDELRKVLTPDPHDDEKERDTFEPTALTFFGALLTSHGVPVIFDAIANRRAYREMARQQIQPFLEAHVNSPLETCVVERVFLTSVARGASIAN